MLSSRSINILYFYSTVPQGYFLLLWFGNVLLSCALMLVWKFDALDAASPPLLHRGNTSLSPLHSPFDLPPRLLLSTSSTSQLLLHFFLFPLLFPPFPCLFKCGPSHPRHFQIHTKKTNKQKKPRTHPSSLSTLFFLRYSPLVDLIGVGIRGDAWNMVSDAFNKVPGESCT